MQIFFFNFLKIVILTLVAFLLFIPYIYIHLIYKRTSKEDKKKMSNNKMSYADLLSLISSDRREFVYKIYYEIISNSVSITNDTYNDNSSEIPEREVRKTTFLSLVT